MRSSHDLGPSSIDVPSMTHVAAELLSRYTSIPSLALSTPTPLSRNTSGSSPYTRVFRSSPRLSSTPTLPSDHHPAPATDPGHGPGPGPGPATVSLPASVIIRQAPVDFDPDNAKDWNVAAFLRDWAALQFLGACAAVPSDAHAPRLYAGHRALGALVLEDLGPGECTLEDLLVAAAAVGKGGAGCRGGRAVAPAAAAAAQEHPGVDAAASAVMALARRLACMHGETMGGETARYYEVLSRLNGKVAKRTRECGAGYLSAARIDEVVEMMRVLLGDDVSPTAVKALRDELRSVSDTLQHAGAFTAMTHMNVRPDRVIVQEKGDVRLVGFGHGQPAHALLDLAFILMGFPSNVLAARLPPALLHSVQATYMAHLHATLSKRLTRRHIAPIENQTFACQLAIASAYWLVRALDDLADAEEPSDSDSDFNDEDDDEDDDDDTDGGESDGAAQGQRNSCVSVAVVRGQVLARIEAFVRVCEAATPSTLPRLRAASRALLRVLRKRWTVVTPPPVYRCFAEAREMLRTG